MTNNSPEEPEHGTRLRLQVTEVIAELAEVAADNPQHRVWAEREPGLEHLTYIAQRREGTDASPYIIITDDLGELRAALRHD